MTHLEPVQRKPHYLLGLCLALCVGCAKDAATDVSINIDRAGQFSTRQPVSEQELKLELKSRYDRTGNFRVLIQASNETPYRYVDAAIAVCSDIGLWYVTLADSSGEFLYPDADYDWEKDVETGPLRHAPTNLLQVAVSADGFDLSKIANAPAGAELVVMCRQNTIYGALLSVLRACSSQESKEVYQIEMAED